MKKFLKIITSLSLAFFVLFGLTACKTPLSSTTVSDEKSIVNSKSTNGGITAVRGEYLYFVNGTVENDGTSSRGNTQGSICRVKYDNVAGKVAEGAEVEIVVSDLVGYDEGSINIFGDFLYYTTPCDSVNYNGTALNYKTEFKRYDLVNNQTYSLYTSYLNDSSEVVSYSYYIVGDELYLLIYEDVTATITSLKIDDSTSVAYKIEDVTSCVFSDNFGKRVDENVVDANNFVFYTKAPTIAADGYDEGSKVYKTSPNKDNSKWIGNESADDIKHNKVEILSIKNGKLIYSDESDITNKTFIYAQAIGENTMLSFADEDIISHKAYDSEDDMILFDEQADGSVSVVAYNSTSYQIVYIQKESGENVPHTIINFGEETKVDFVGTTSLSVDEINAEGNVVETNVIEYLLYTVTDDSDVSLFKIELKRNGEIVTSPNLELLISSDDGMVAMDGLVMPEVIGNNLFVMVEYENDNKKSEGVYLHFADITKEIDEEDNKLNVIKK